MPIRAQKGPIGAKLEQWRKNLSLEMGNEATDSLDPKFGTSQAHSQVRTYSKLVRCHQQASPKRGLIGPKIRQTSYAMFAFFLVFLMF